MGSYSASIQSHQNAVKRRRAAASLDVPQDSNSGVLIESVHDNLFDLFARDRLAVSGNRTFRHDDNVQSLALSSFLKKGRWGRQLMETDEKLRTRASLR
jgi:hypothetical protein